MVAPLKLSTSSSSSSSGLTLNRFETDLSERRLFARRAVRARIDGWRLDHSLTARRQPRLQLQLQDLSLGGLSALTDLPVACGERLSVSFPATNRSLGWDAYGRVIRCDPTGLGYRVALEFDPLPAA